jgi:hypothetical protein
VTVERKGNTDCLTIPTGELQRVGAPSDIRSEGDYLAIMFPRPVAAGMSLQKQPMLLHQPIDALGVDRFLPGGSPLALEERGDPSIRIARPLIDIAATVPSKHTYLVLQPLAGAMSNVAADATAFGPRDMNYMFEFDSMWSDPADGERNIAWTRQNWADLQRFSTGGMYINFPGFGEEGEKLVRSAVGDKSYERLAKIKQKYDPDNLFRLNQNIKPAR